jgi:hypothetical protein
VSAPCPLVLVVPLLVTLGCAGVPDRSSSHGSPTTVPGRHEVPVRGFPVHVETIDGVIVEGELLAVGPERIWVLGGREGPVWSVPLDDTASVKLQTRQRATGWYVLWSILGLASTPSHGLLMLGSVPMWLTVGTGTVASEAASGSARVSDEMREQLSPYARFPAGPTPRLRRFAPQDCDSPCPALVSGQPPP